MAEKYLNNSGLEYFWGKIKGYPTLNNLNPILSKTFTGVVASGNSDPEGWYYFGWLKPISYNTPWKIRYRIYSTIAGITDYPYGFFDVQIVGCYNTYYQYDIYNFNYSYRRSLYSHVLYTCTSTGITNEYGPLLGMRLQSSYNSTTAANSRTFQIEILETIKCNFTFFDNFTLYANVPGTGSTNYFNRYTFDGTSNGHKMAGDANDVNYQNRNYYGTLWKMYTNLYGYMICFQKSDVYLLPANVTSNSTVGTKTLTSENFDPFGLIFYYGTTTTINANAKPGDAVMYRQIHSLNLAYSFNTTNTLVAGDPIYVVADVQSDGSAKLASTAISKALPTTEDGHIYIFLGKAINTTNILLYPNHPIFWYKGGRIKYFTKADLNNNGVLWQYNSTNDCVELIFPN